MNDPQKQLRSPTRPTPPTLQRHHTNRSWTTTWRDSQGKQRMKRLGLYPRISKKQAMARWQNWLDAARDAEKAKQVARQVG